MRTHVQVIGWLNIVLGIMTLFGGLVTMGMFGAVGVAAASDPSGHEALPWIGAIGSFVTAILFVTALPSILVGIGLLNFSPWARIAAIVLSILHLANATTFGLSTILGIYSLVVLFSSDTARLFEQQGA